MGSSDHNRRAALSRASRASGASGASRGPRFTRGSACRAIEALQHSAAALGSDNVISWSGNHRTHLVTKTWLPDALLRGCPSPRARSARGAGCPTPSCDRYDLSKTWVSATRLSRRTHTPRHHSPTARPGIHIVPALDVLLNCCG